MDLHKLSGNGRKCPKCFIRTLGYSAVWLVTLKHLEACLQDKLSH